MIITIKQGEIPSADDVLTVLANTVFYADGTPWQATPEQVRVLVELFGNHSESMADNVVPLRAGR